MSYYADDWLTVYLGDCREVMAQMEPESVHCVVTSPPYWGLRDYGVEGQLGLEPTPEEYVANMVAVFREVRHVLRSDGTVWLNLGDSYSGSWAEHSMRPEGGSQRPGGPGFQPLDDRVPARVPNVPGLKPKDLVGIPWRVAFALQADGWYLRSDIIWAKSNPMPESVTDRPTKSHEYLFLLSKSAHYYFDADAVREPALQPEGIPRLTGQHKADAGGFTTNGHGPSTLGTNQGATGRNLRSVWTIATQPYPGAHFATFPRALVEPCIKAGTSEKGVCPECGAPWVRESESSIEYTQRVHNHPKYPEGQFGHQAANRHQDGHIPGRKVVTTTGWRPGCNHPRTDRDALVKLDGREVYEPVPAVVLDPFAGSGTTGVVAQSLSRRAVLIDLNGDYLKQVMDRNRQPPLGLGAA